MAGSAAFETVMQANCTPSPFSRKRDNSEMSKLTPSPPAGPKLKLKWGTTDCSESSHEVPPSQQPVKPFSSGFWAEAAVPKSRTLPCHPADYSSHVHEAFVGHCSHVLDRPVNHQEGASTSSDAATAGEVLGCSNHVHHEATANQEPASPGKRAWGPASPLTEEAPTPPVQPEATDPSGTLLAVAEEESDWCALKAELDSHPSHNVEEAPASSDVTERQPAAPWKRARGPASPLTEEAPASPVQPDAKDPAGSLPAVTEEEAERCALKADLDSHSSHNVKEAPASSDVIERQPAAPRKRARGQVSPLTKEAAAPPEQPEATDPAGTSPMGTEEEGERCVLEADPDSNSSCNVDEAPFPSGMMENHPFRAGHPSMLLPGCDTIEAQLNAYNWTADEAADETKLAKTLSFTLMQWLKALVEQHIILDSSAQLPSIKLESMRPIRELLCMEPMDMAGIMQAVAKQAEPDDLPSTSPKIERGHWLLGCKVETRGAACTISAREFHTGKPGAPKMLGSMTFTSKSKPSWLPLVFTMALRGVMKLMWQPSFHVQPTLVKLTVQAIKDDLKTMGAVDL
jgi:hypothetical protein